LFRIAAGREQGAARLSLPYLACGAVPPKGRVDFAPWRQPPQPSGKACQ
jgi:hypothetical protein